MKVKKVKPSCWKWQFDYDGVMVIVAGNGHGDTSSNPGWDWLLFT